MSARVFVLSALALSAALLLAGVPQLHFGWGWHNDEPTKVLQILDGAWNLRHPPLMLELVSAATRTLRLTDGQAVAFCGRLLSLLAAGTVMVGGMWLAGRQAGTLAGLGAGLVLFFQPALFEAGHYFKEDALFLAALMLTFTALFACERSAGRGAWLGLGAALALTVSVKYSGWLLVPAVALFAGLRGGKHWPLTLAALVLLTLAVNLPLLTDWRGFRESFGDELYRLGHGDYGMSSARSLAWNYLALAARQIPWPLLAGYIIYAGWRLRRGATPAEWIFLAVPPLTLAALALTAKYSERYLLPLTVTVSVAGLYGPLLMTKRPALKITLAVALTVSGCVWTGGAWLGLHRGFQHDSRAELTAWICRHLPADAVIAEDTYAKINQYALQGRVLLDNFFAADIGPLDELRALGVTHLIISYDVYHRFVDGSAAPPSGQAADFARRRLFYETARRQKILWHDANANPKALHPGLTLVEL
ncbi:MAG: glycosyltransferase family 39 protein [Verrucomicrobiales bacterium]|nr:glycosyltransferase family 39 protein [Verrucomicrobiales bacterium]